MLFKALVRPHLEYAVALWNPRLMELIVVIKISTKKSNKIDSWFSGLEL